MATIPSSENEYEFSAGQNVQFKAAAYWMGIMGWLGILFGALACLSVLVGNLPGPISGVVGIVVGVLTVRAGSAFGRVAGTTGRDIENVMEAVANLKRLYRFQVILIGIAFGLIILAIILAIVLAGPALAAARP